MSAFEGARGVRNHLENERLIDIRLLRGLRVGPAQMSIARVGL